MITIYHNPRCGKSRETLKLIDASGKENEVILYLKNPPSESELRAIVAKLGLPVQDIIRKNEALFKEKFKKQAIEDDDWYAILVENPILIERPIVIKGDKAILGRPPQNVEALL